MDDDHPSCGRTAAELPPAGGVRVGPRPEQLPSRPSGEPGPNRYDAPDGGYLVRYVGEDLQTCLVEYLARFRSKPAVDRILAEVSGVDDGYGTNETSSEDSPIEGRPPHEIADALDGVLRRLKVARVFLRQEGKFADTSDPFTRSALEKDPQVGKAIRRFDDLVAPHTDQPSHLDGALIRLGGSTGRRITQAVSRAVHEDGGFIGVAYHSRWWDAKRCWAIFDETLVSVERIEPLSSDNQEHRAAVGAAAKLHDLPLPPAWR